MKYLVPLVLLLTGCDATPMQLVSGIGGFGVASVATIGRTPIDAVISLVSGRDCSLVHMDRGEGYCRAREAAPDPPAFCTRSLGGVDCWAEPEALPGKPREVADGPRGLTEQQELNRTRRWPF